MESDKMNHLETLVKSILCMESDKMNHTETEDCVWNLIK